jgi:hypothetical protein
MWRGNLNAKQVKASAQKFLDENDVMALVNTPEGWERIVNFECVDEFVSDTYPVAEMRSLHFLTAAVRFLETDVNVAEMDATIGGMRVYAAKEHAHETAHEWLGHIFMAGVAAMGGGATFQQIGFSKVAARNLSGNAANSPDPMQLAIFFSQMAAAGKRHGKSKPFTAGNQQVPRMVGGEKPNVQIPVRELDAIKETAGKLAPKGVDRNVIDKAVAGVTAKTGTSFAAKPIQGWKSLGQGKIRDGESEASYSVA